MTEPIWVEKSIVLAIHQLQISAYGGTFGARDLALLDSALSRPRHAFTYTESSICELSAIYTHGIIKNHPFLDGNKRTGFVTGILFLELNGYQLTATEPAATKAIMALASGAVDESYYSTWLERQSIKN